MLLIPIQMKKTEGVTDTSMDEDANIYSFDELEDIFDQNITCETDLISEESENIQEAVIEFWNDDSYCSNTNEAFPHEAYRDFVKIEIKYQLSYMDGDAILKYFEKKNHTEFLSIPVAEIKDQVYSFEYRPIISAIKKILQNQKLAANRVFNYQEIYVSIRASKILNA
ncbi:hypothetical protein F8M41_017590 [Gigaspora margarita]|uniref:Uncharacterized protein n=1 Tax=Gigaspora margarita TaxID=4874 RepID=A0A8H4EM17_GIGMA|nr:hypothetical protein F8M41_017590 [Gigaspora margarita]